jgi:hypothetical protein
MLKKQKTRCLLLILFAAMMFTASKAYGAQIEEKTYPEDIIELKQPRYIIPANDKDLWILFINPKDEIVAENARSKAKFIINADQQGKPSEAVGCVINGKFHTAWRAKTDAKTLLFTTLDLKASRVESPIIVDKTTEPLPRIKLGCIENVVNLVWYGERADSKGHKNSIYASRSFDGGKTFFEPFEVTPQTRASIYPTLVTDEKGNAYVFTEVVNENGREMVFRKTTEKGWEEPVSIGKVGIVSLYIRPLKVGNRLMVFWFNSYEDGVPVTEMAYSDDGGKTWQRQVFETTRYFDLTGMQAVAGDDQNVYLVLSAVDKSKPEDDPRKLKDQLLFYYSNDGGKSFSGPINIRHDAFGSYTRAQFPNIVAKGKTVVVVWNDYRNIRANLYMNYSTDGGVTWQDKDIPLEGPGKFNTVLHWDVNNLIEQQGTYYVLAHRFKTDAMDEAYPVLISFKLSK